MPLIKGTAGKKIGLIFILLFIRILITPVVSAGTIQQNQGNVILSSTGKFILKPLESSKIVLPINQKATFFFQADTINISSKPPTYDETATACGINGCGGNVGYPNYNVIMNIPIQPRFTSAPTILNLKINQNGEFIYDSVYNETAYACGNCGVGSGIYSFV